MKNFSEYIQEELMLDYDILLTEGFWDKLGKMVGFAKTYPKKLKDEFKTGYTTAILTAAKSKDDEDKEAAKKMADAANEGDKELLKFLKSEIERLDRNLDNIKTSDYSCSQCRLLKELSDKLNDDEGKEQAEKFQKVIDKKWPKASDKIEELEKKVEKSNVAENEPKKEETGEKIDDKANLGITDDDKLGDVTPEQQKKGVEEQIKNDKDYLGKLVSHIYEVNNNAKKIDGDTLAAYVDALITTAFKKVERDEKTGHAIEKWNISAIESIDNNFPGRLVDGISTVICGLLMLGSAHVNKVLIEKLAPGDTKKFEALVKDIESFKKE